MRKLLWAFGVMAVAFSCLDEPDCIRTTDTALVIQFKKFLTAETDTVIFYRVEADGTDSIFYGQTPVDELDTLNTGQVTVAIDPFSDSTSFTFFFPVLDRNLKIGYTRTARFISEDCGSEVLFSDLTILETEFDSITVVNPYLTEDRLTNIEIFR